MGVMVVNGGSLVRYWSLSRTLTVRAGTRKFLTWCLCFFCLEYRTVLDGVNRWVGFHANRRDGFVLQLR